ncbi:hypothetical protein DM860_009140 [Cuscuta australis]|uniref:Uncharacterized protein n=1 Tax=Cuscuta australis TaxID=267555 RepID=A0A328DFF0_9ASTE|nr:hypothetical protein DM860_009140 [Cuscuta australis]
MDQRVLFVTEMKVGRYLVKGTTKARDFARNSQYFLVTQETRRLLIFCKNVGFKGFITLK